MWLAGLGEAEGEEVFVVSLQRKILNWVVYGGVDSCCLSAKYTLSRWAGQVIIQKLGQIGYQK